MTANVTVIVEQRDDVLVVPNSAISFGRSQAEQLRAEQAAAEPAASASPAAQEGGAPAQAGAGRGARARGAGQGAGERAQSGEGGAMAMVVVLRDGQPTPARVRIGSSDERNTQVLGGLQPGDEVVVGLSGPSEGAVSKPQGQGNSILPVPGGRFRPGGR
jgi:HlyD family secretion protein